jgi:hypothetical protein
MSYRDEYQQWPFLTGEEFTLACAFFDQRYIRAKLGPTRKLLKIISRRTATTGGSYIEILRLLQPPKDDDDLALALEKLSGFGGSGTDTGMDVEMANDDDDQVRVYSLSISIPKFRKLPSILFTEYTANRRNRRSCARSFGKNQKALRPDTVFTRTSHMLFMKYISTRLTECQLCGSLYMTYQWEILHWTWTPYSDISYQKSKNPDFGKLA